MSFPNYPRYKDSGSEWLGDVPDHWSRASLKWLAQIYSGGTPDRSNEAYWSDGTIPWLGSGEVNQMMITEATEFITELGFQSSSAKWVPAGALMMALAGQGRTKGMVAQTALAATCNQSMAAIVPRHELNPRFLFWWLSGNYQRIRNLAGGDLRDGLNLELLGGIECPLAPASEQEQISSFLDRETAKIDVLIAEQQRLIELLKEKRKAVISHAVTRGLNPNALMKPSGLAWLGDVPAHWEMTRLKHISPAITVGLVVNPSTYVADAGLPFIYGGDIREGVIDWKSARRISAELSNGSPKTRLQTGDLLTVRVGAPGVTAVVPAECEGGNCASVMLIRRGNYNSEWLSLLMNTRAVRFQVEVVQYGAAQEQFNIGHAINFWMPVPPRAEQDEIVTTLDAAISKIDVLVSEAHRATTLLQERRTALISAAVTGKIDVRGLAEAA
jgi:type I restriction enzyme S subunit